MFAVAAPLCIGAAPSVRIEPWGTDSLRVRVAPAGTSVATDLPTALVGELDRFEQKTKGAKPTAPPVVSGNLRVVEVDGKRRFERVSDGQILLVESWLDHPAPGSLPHSPLDPTATPPPLSVGFDVGSYDAYGLGQQRQTCYKECCSHMSQL